MLNPSPYTPAELIRAMRFVIKTGITTPASREAETQGLLAYRPAFSVWIITPRGLNFITDHEDTTP